MTGTVWEKERKTDVITQGRGRGEGEKRQYMKQTRGQSGGRTPRDNAESKTDFWEASASHVPQAEGGGG